MTSLVFTGVQDVLVDGTSIVGLTPSASGNPPVAVLPNLTNGWITGDVISGSLTGNDMAWNGLLTIVDTCGFQTTANIEVTSCAIPNVFTPNGDPENDDFEIRGLLGEMGSVLTIFNRNGVKIYESEIEDPDVNKLAWGGFYEGGEPAPEGVYLWVLTRPDGEKEVGNITLLR